MRQILWCWVGLLAAACGGGGGGVDPGPPVRTLSLTQTASGDVQSGRVASTLLLPLRVVVDSAGSKIPGVEVTWLASGGIVRPQTSVTDAAGIATATWTLDTVAGVVSATATAAGLRKVTFAATAIPGPAASLRNLSGDNQTVGVNAAFFLPLGVDVTDRYGNPVIGQVTWTVEHGPVAFIDPSGGPSNLDRSSSVRLHPTGTEGAALVRAALGGTAATADFALAVGPPQYVVLVGASIDFQTGYTNMVFVSVQNRTTNPAIDTIPVGQTVVWMRAFGLGQRRVISVGTPSFPSPGDVPYGVNPTVNVTFTVPGTYHYADQYHSAATGTIVVR